MGLLQPLADGGKLLLKSVVLVLMQVVIHLLPSGDTQFGMHCVDHAASLIPTLLHSVYLLLFIYKLDDFPPEVEWI